MLTERKHLARPTGLQRQATTMSDVPATIIRTRVYREGWTPALDEALNR